MEEEWVEGKAGLSVAGEPLEVGFRVPAASVKLGRMLPVFQQMSDNFNDLGVTGIEAQGKSISCKAGCGACCRQLVPLSEAEAFDLRQVVEALPEERRSVIKQRFSDGMEKLGKIDFFTRLAGAAEGESSAYSEILREYFSQQIACPFLENESCSIHEHRPVACREYLVTSPAENCSSATGEGIENVQYLLKVKDTLITLGRNRLKPELPYVPLISLMQWTDKREDDSPERTGAEWMKLFLSKMMEVSEMANSQN